MGGFWPEECPIKAGEWAYIQIKYRLGLRELQVVKCIACGCRDKEIAEKMEVTLTTAKEYVRFVLRKFRARNKVSLLIKLFNDARSSEVNTYIKKYMKNEENM